jgi:hypothetical protein
MYVCVHKAFLLVCKNIDTEIYIIARNALLKEDDSASELDGIVAYHLF